MALSSRTPSAAVAAGFVPELWTNKVIDAAQNNLVCWDAFDTSRWKADLQKGNKLYIPLTTHVTASEVVVGTIGAAASSSLDITSGQTAKTITINQWYEAPVDWDEMTALQTQVDYQAEIQKEQGYAIAKNMDTYINSLFSALNGSSVYGSDGQTLTDDILLAIKETLDEADVPLDGDRSLIIDPSCLVDLLKIDKFIAQQYGTMGPVKNGVIGTTPIYGCTVRVTNNLTTATTGSYAVMAHKKAIGGIAQMRTAWAEEYKTYHLTRYNIEVLYGASELRDAFGVPFYTRKS